ncbi:MAG: hypothetical protein RIQ81_1461 [Pseudomonadota bacterium]|jgi:hypothetical protein
MVSGGQKLWTCGPAACACLVFAACLGLAVPSLAAGNEAGVFSVLVMERNQTGPYAVMSGGTSHGIQLQTEVCVLKAGSKKERLFCSPVVNVRTRAAAFYIPQEFETEVSMGSQVVMKNPLEASPAEDQTATEEDPTEAHPAPPETTPTNWFPGGQKIDAGYLLQLSPAIAANSVSFAALPRETNNDPFQARDTLNIAPLGLRFSWGTAFLNPQNFLGVRLSWAMTSPVSYKNDYDLTDVNSYVESSTSVSHLGAAVWYGTDRNMTDVIGWRASAGLGLRRSTIKVTSEVKGAATMKIVDGTVIASAPAVELTTGARYKFMGVDFTGDFVLAVPFSVTSSVTGTVNTTQDVSTADLKSSLLRAVDPSAGLEMALVAGASLSL